MKGDHHWERAIESGYEKLGVLGKRKSRTLLRKGLKDD